MSADDAHATPGETGLGAFLKGVRVLDLSQYIPGPMATLFLADMGAEVLKIEPPKGDEMRNLGPKDSEGRPIYYRTLNAGKNVRRMNLKNPVERAAFLDLAREADIVVEGFRPGVMARLGIGWPVLRRLNPQLILCSISGYGAQSPKAMQAGHDANYLAEMGVAHRNGSTAPLFYDPPLADSAGSLFAAMLLLGALHGRSRTGQGCCLDLALADTVMPLQMMQVAEIGAGGGAQKRRSYYLNGGAAFYQVYPIAGGAHIMLGAVEPKFWANFCMELGRPDLVARHADAMPQTALIDEVGRLVAGLCREDIARRFDGKDCCVSLVRDLGETLAGPHVRDRRLVRTDGAGEIQSLLPVRIDGEPPSLRAPLRETDGTGNWSVPTEREHTGEKKSSDPPDPVAARTDARRSGE